MPKTSSKWVCQECGHTSQSYLGRCPECNSFGSLIEEITTKGSLKFPAKNITENKFTPSNEIQLSDNERIKSIDKELDILLGGGFVSGSLLLLAGEPGIGKSTILLQIADHLAQNHKVAYVTAEESVHQVKLRANRLHLKNNLLILSENDLETILSLIENEKPEFLIVDSIQAIYLRELESSSGSVSQVRECANRLLRLSKDKKITTVLVGHVNKEGQIAGPKVLEHIVDTVLYFEGEKFHNFRILRATKNRFGASDEIVVFEMKDTGLKPITNPSFLFISPNKESVPGSTYSAILEGSKTIIAEVQALVGGTTYIAPRRVANGLDYNRVLQIIAILERRVGFNFSKHDLYVNLVGGLSSFEPALDLSIAMSIVSCKQDVIPKKKTVYIGEIGLVGEIRPVNQTEIRIKEAVKLGFEQVVIPSGAEVSVAVRKNIEVIEAKKLLDAIRLSLSQSQSQ